MKLIQFEMKKVLKDRRFWGIWLILLALQVFLTVRAELPANEYVYTASEYEALYEALQVLQPVEAVDELEQRIEAYEAEEWAEIMGDIMAELDGTPKEEDAEQEEPLSRERQQATAAIDAILPENTYAARKLIEAVHREISSVVGRDALVAQTIRRADQMQGLTLFQGAIDEAELGNLKKTKADFLKAESFPISELFAERGVVMMFDNPTADVFVLLMLFLAMHLMVAAGYGNGMETLVLSCREGRGQAIVARVAALFLMTGLVWGSFYIAQSVIAMLMYSWGGLGRPIQMISDYVKCLFTVNVGGMLFVYFLWKWLWFFLLILLQMAAMKWLQREVWADGLIAGLWGLGFFLWENIAENSIHRIWKYINVYYLLRPDEIWAGYNNIRVGSWWVNGWLFASVVTVVLLAISMWLLWLSRERTLMKARAFVWRKKRTKPSFLGLKTAEFFKCYRVLHIGLLMLGLLWLQWDTYREDAIRWGQDEMAYRSYLVQWERELTGPDVSLEQIMAEEEAELMAGLRGESEKYSVEMAKVLQTGLLLAKLRYESALATAAERNESIFYFFEGEFVRLIDSPERDLLHGAQASLLLVLLMAYLVGREHSSGMRRMIRSTGQGESRYYRNKLVVLLSLVMFVMTLVYGPDLLLTWKTYGFESAAASVGSMPNLAHFPWRITIGGYLIWLYMWRYLLLTLLGLGVIVVVEWSKNTLIAVILCVIVVWLPYLLYYLGADWAVSWGILPYLSGNVWFFGWNV